MSKWGNAFAGGVAGVGKGIADYAAGELDKQRKTDLMQLEHQLRMQAAEKAEALRRDGVIWENQGDGADAKLGFTQRQGEQQTGIEVGRQREVGAVKNDQAVDLEGRLRPLKVETAKQEAKARDDVEVEGVIARGGNKAYLSAHRALKAAERVYGPGDQLAAFQLKQAQEVAKMRGDLSKEQDPVKRRELQQKLDDVTGKPQLSDRETLQSVAQLMQGHARLLKQAESVDATDEERAEAREAAAQIGALVKGLQGRLGDRGVVSPGTDDPAQGGDAFDDVAAKLEKRFGKPKPAQAAEPGRPAAPPRPVVPPRAPAAPAQDPQRNPWSREGK